MIIDERLERLTERHEALTQTVELMAAENRAAIKRLAERQDSLTGVVEQMVRSIDTLVRVAELHEHRLDNLEGGAA